MRTPLINWPKRTNRQYTCQIAHAQPGLETCNEGLRPNSLVAIYHQISNLASKSTTMVSGPWDDAPTNDDPLWTYKVLHGSQVDKRYARDIVRSIVDPTTRLPDPTRAETLRWAYPYCMYSNGAYSEDILAAVTAAHEMGESLSTQSVDFTRWPPFPVGSVAAATFEKRGGTYSKPPPGCYGNF